MKAVTRPLTAGPFCALLAALASFAVAGDPAAPPPSSPPTPAADPTRVTALRPRALIDHAGAIREVALHYRLDMREELAPLFDDLFATLAPDVAVQVLCPDDDAVTDFNRRWGARETQRGRDMRIYGVDRPITVWARDRRIARQAEDGHPAALLVPREAPDYDESQIGELCVADQLEYAHQLPAAQHVPLHIEGGNVVGGLRHVFVGRNVFDENLDEGLTPSDVRRRLLYLFGRPPIVLHDRSGNVPWPHCDMYLTPIDDRTVLLASTVLGDALLRNALDEIDDPQRLIEALSGSAETHDSLEQIAAQLREYGYRVLRVPAVMHPDEDWMITYNNVLIDERDGCRTVLLPRYGLPVLDDTAESLYRSLGFEIASLDVSRLYEYGGAVRCVVNVLSRDDRTASPHVATRAPAGRHPRTGLVPRHVIPRASPGR